MKRVQIQWDGIQHSCKVLARVLREELSDRSIEKLCICPVARGGLIPATILAYDLKRPIPLLSENPDGLGCILPPFRHTILSNNFLTVDDIVDTGNTFARIYSRWPRNQLFASLYVKPCGLQRCKEAGITNLYYAALVEDDVWLDFPWAPHDFKPEEH